MAITKLQQQAIRHRMESRVREKGVPVTWSKDEANTAMDDIERVWEGTLPITKSDVPGQGIGIKELIVNKLTIPIDNSDLFVEETLREILR